MRRNAEAANKGRRQLGRLKGRWSTAVGEHLLVSSNPARAGFTAPQRSAARLKHGHRQVRTDRSSQISAKSRKPLVLKFAPYIVITYHAHRKVDHHLMSIVLHSSTLFCDRS